MGKTKNGHEKYNLIVIGGGSAGLVSAYIAAQLKARVCLIEKHKMGGDCLNYGCIPSKAIIASAKYVHSLRNPQKYGIKSVDFDFDFTSVMDRVHASIKKIEPHDSMERYRGLGVECFQGTAKIIEPHVVEVDGKKLWGKNIIIASGASPFVPPLAGIADAKYRTSENLWDMRELPAKLTVLGGGPIGCEMTQAFQRLGSQVTQVEMAPRILGREDDDVAQFMIEKLQSEGVKILGNTKASGVQNNSLSVSAGGKNEEIPFDELLVAVGRKPNTTGMGLEELGLEFNRNGTIKVDSYMRTTKYKHIFACGDVAGPYQFTHTAAHQAWYCAVNALVPLWKYKANYDVIPWVTFTDPEIAQVGHNELSAQKAGLGYEVAKYELDGLDRAITESNNAGFVKVLTPKGKDRILGATIVGPYAGEMLTEFVAAMKAKKGLNSILGTIHSYPTLSEANKFAAGNWKKANKPEGILKWVEKMHKMRL